MKGVLDGLLGTPGEAFPHRAAVLAKAEGKGWILVGMCGTAGLEPAAFGAWLAKSVSDLGRRWKAGGRGHHRSSAMAMCAAPSGAYIPSMGLQIVK
jgi:hypothetical protein